MATYGGGGVMDGVTSHIGPGLKSQPGFFFFTNKPIGAAPRWHFWGVGGVRMGCFEKKV